MKWKLGGVGGGGGGVKCGLQDIPCSSFEGHRWANRIVTICYKPSFVPRSYSQFGNLPCSSRTILLPVLPVQWAFWSKAKCNIAAMPYVAPSNTLFAQEWAVIPKAFIHRSRCQEYSLTPRVVMCVITY